MSLNCIIVDDEPNAVKLLEVLIGQHTNWHCLALCFNAMEAHNFLKTQQVDFIFLDINMPQLSGLELAALLPPATKIVFTTAYAEHAAESFNFYTIDYLLKPITLKRFLAAVSKIESYFETSRPASGKAPDPGYFFFKSGKTLKKIALMDVLYFESQQEYVRVVTSSEQLLIYRRLKDIQEQLGQPFIRVHNSFIVNCHHIDQIKDNHIYIREKMIPISEKFKDEFLKFIESNIF